MTFAVDWALKTNHLSIYPQCWHWHQVTQKCSLFYPTSQSQVRLHTAPVAKRRESHLQSLSRSLIQLIHYCHTCRPTSPALSSSPGFSKGSHPICQSPSSPQVIQYPISLHYSPLPKNLQFKRLNRGTLPLMFQCVDMKDSVSVNVSVRLHIAAFTPYFE